jgi:LruC domain-containing protein/uncharacterized repeat protein (TIGR01451 family)
MMKTQPTPVNHSLTVMLRIVGIVFLSLFLSIQSYGQASFILNLQYNPMNFLNSNRTVLVNNGNNGAATGSVHKYTNLITVNDDLGHPITVYGKMTILENHGATINNFDDDAITGEAHRFQPRLKTTASDGGYITYQLEFFDQATNASVYIYNYYMTLIDNDGTSSSNREFVEVGGYSSYQKSNLCQLVIGPSPIPGSTRTRFTGITSSLNGVTFDNTASLIANFLNANNRISFTLGQTGPNDERYYSVQMGAKGGNLDNPVVVNNPLPVAVDDNGATLNSATGGVAVANVLTNDLYNGVAIVPSQVTISQVTAPSNSGVVLNTTTGQVTVAPGTPGGTYTLTYKISMNARPADVDIATVTCRVLQANLGISKSGTVTTVTGGQNVTYTLTVTNAGPTEALLATVNDVLPAQLTLISASPSVGTWTGANWAIGTLANGATATTTIVARISNTFSGSLSNTATVSSPTTDPVLGNNSSTAANTVVALTGPTANNDAATTPAGTPVTFNVITNDRMGSGDIVLSSLAWVAGTTPPASTGAFTFNSTGDVTFTPAAGFSGVATISYTIKDVNTLTSNVAVITCTVTKKADLVITKSAVQSAGGGKHIITYSIVVHNNGPTDAETVAVSDPINAALTVTSATTATGTWSAPNWTIGNLANGADATLTIVATADAEFSGSIVNLATVSSATTDPVASNNTSSVTTAVTVLTGPTAGNDVATTPAGVPVTIIALNNDPKGSGNIVPSTLTFVAGSTPPTSTGVFTKNSAGEVLFTPAAGFSGTATISYTIKDDNGFESNVATITCTVTKKADLSVTKTAVLSAGGGKQIITYTIAVHNNGPTDALSVSVSDVVPASLTVTSATTATGIWSAPNWTIGSMANGADATLTIVAEAAASFSGSIVNTAYVSSGTSDPNSDNNSSTATTPVTTLSGPTAVNDAATTPAGTPVTFNVITNDTKGSGNIVLSSVVFVAGTTPPSSTGVFTVNTAGDVTFTPAAGFSGTATINYTIQDVNGLGSNVATITCTVTKKADLSVVKTSVLTAGNGKQIVTYTIAVHNNGPTDALTVSVSDVVPASLTVTSATTATGSWSAPNWTIGSMANGADATLTIVAEAAASFSGSIVNTAYVTSGTSDPNSSNNSSTATTTVSTLTGPTAINDAATTPAGTPVTILAISNDTKGTGNIVPTSLAFVAGSAPPASTGAFTITPSGDVLFTPAAGFSGTATINYTILDENGLFSNAATITCTVTKKADLAITKTAVLSAGGGKHIVTYTIGVHNNGPTDALTVTVNDLVPANLTVTSATTVTGTWSAPLWTIGNMANGADATLTIVAEAAPEFTGSLVNSARVNSPTADPNSDNNVASVTTEVSSLSVPVANNDAAKTEINTPVTFNVLTNDTKGTGNIIVSSVTWVAGTIPPASTGAFTVNALGDITFTPANGFSGTATIRYQILDDNGLSAQATITVSILKADLNITKTAVLSVVNAEQIVTYLITVNNIGPDPAKLVTVNDVIQTGLTVTSATPSLGTWTAPTWAVGNMASGASATLTIKAKVGEVANGALSNTALVSSNTFDPVSSNNTATATNSSYSGPHANDDAASTTVDMPTTINVTGNDTPGSTPIDITKVTFVSGTEPLPTVGLFTVSNVTGIVTFTPANGFLGTATIKYQIIDGNGLTSQATITVIVTPSLINNFPANGNGTLAFEDLWPAKGDYDFNDLVLDYRFQTTSNANNKVEKVVATFVIKAFGASFENGFGFQYPGVNSANIQSVSGTSLTDGYITNSANGTESGQAKATIIVYDNAFKQIPYSGAGIGVNTDPTGTYMVPKTLTVTINFVPNTTSVNDLNIANFNPFLIVNKVRGVEVHLPNYAPTSLVNQTLFGSADDKSVPANGIYYKTANNLPWAINIIEKFDWPKEKVDIISVHLHFAQWATSGGVLFPDWYKNLTGYRNASLIYPVPGQ